VKLQNAWNKYGSESFVFEVLEHCDKNLLQEKEQYWIDLLDTCNKGFNISKKAGVHIGGGMVAGTYRHSKEVRLKISAKNKGRKVTQEWIERMRTYSVGRKLTLEHRVKCSEALKGRVFTDEHKAKISNALKGKKLSHSRDIGKRYLAKAYKITSPEGVVYEVLGLPEFCQLHGLTRSSMSSVANGDQKHHKNWKCEFMDKSLLTHAIPDAIPKSDRQLMLQQIRDHEASKQHSDHIHL
jgi:group I intron endonuclease